MRQVLLTILMACLALLGRPAWAVPADQPDLNDLRQIPCQDNGRLKPLDTVARESVRVITGQSSFKGEDPMWTELRWMADPEKASTEANLECRNLDLKKALGVSVDQRWFSLDELRKNPKFESMRTSLMNNQMGNDASAQDKEFAQLANKMEMLLTILAGEQWRVIPNPTDMNQDWSSLPELKGQEADPKKGEVIKGLTALLQAAHEQKYPEIKAASTQFASALAACGPTPSVANMAREVHYNAFHPFRQAWILYALAFFPLFFAPSSRSRLYWIGFCTAALGFSMHCYGFYLRCSIAGRPPVTNMYESVIWVAFGAVLFALVFEMLFRARNYLLAALVVSTVCLVLGDSLPAVLDPSIKPLTPVLRSNFWLTIHVLTITLSYAAFALALGLGHMVVFTYAFQGDRKERVAGLNKALYKAIQIGVLLLAAGTILGGVWANYSWGRFWGWDPKEVWALTALLGYLALLHGRHAGWLRNYGLAAGSIIAFMGVMMAWYGVNFVLGVGLHSYGFGTGGLQYVMAWVTVEFGFLGYATWRWRHSPTYLMLHRKNGE